MKKKTISMYLTNGKTDFQLCQDGDKRWLEFPDGVKIANKSDAKGVVEIIQRTLCFLEGDTRIWDYLK